MASGKVKIPRGTLTTAQTKRIAESLNDYLEQGTDINITLRATYQDMNGWYLNENSKCRVCGKKILKNQISVWIRGYNRTATPKKLDGHVHLFDCFAEFRRDMIDRYYIERMQALDYITGLSCGGIK